MKNILKIFSIIILITGLFIPLKTSAISKESLQELIDNNKIEEVFKKENYYELKVKLSDTYKELVTIPFEEKESVDLLMKAYNINALLINGSNNNIVSAVENDITNNESKENNAIKSEAIENNNELEINNALTNILAVIAFVFVVTTIIGFIMGFVNNAPEEDD